MDENQNVARESIHWYGLEHLLNTDRRKQEMRELAQELAASDIEVENVVSHGWALKI